MPSCQESRTESFVVSEAKTKEGLQSIKVLMAEDDDYYYRFVAQLLHDQSDISFELTRTTDLSSTLENLAQQAPDIILLDLSLPDSRGLDTLVKVNERAGLAPVIILTGSDDARIGIRAVTEGAQDYLIKQCVGNDSLVRSIRYAIERRKSELHRLRLAAIKDFCAALAHDLQVPLVGANNLLDVIISGGLGSLSDVHEKVLSKLREGMGRQLDLVHRLLEIYRYESPDPHLNFRATDLTAVLAGCIENLCPEIEAKHSIIEVLLPADLKPVWGDFSALHQVFASLLDNALKFGSPDRNVQIWAENCNEQVMVHLRSFGEVISAEDQKLLFEGFWQGVPGKKYVASTGLGLYFCHQVVSVHKGKIICKSSLEEGTTFTVVLPAANVR